MNKYKVTDKEAEISIIVEAQSPNEMMFQVFEDNYTFEKIEEGRKTPLEYYWQRHPRYKGMKLGFSNYSFQLNSCFTNCLAYLADKDPKEVHEILKKAGAYSGAMIISDKAAEALGLDLLQGNSWIPGRMTDINYMPDFTSIKEVVLDGFQHFVIRVYDPEDEMANKYGVYIYDPWTGKKLPINEYDFVTYRLFKVK